MYVASEEDLWIEDATISRDSRNLHGVDDDEGGEENGNG